MKTVQISLNSIDKVKAFVNEISKFDCDFDLVSGRYVIDAKSIMGIFSLDLSKPIDLNIHTDGSSLDTVMEVVKILYRLNHSESFGTVVQSNLKTGFSLRGSLFMSSSNVSQKPFWQTQLYSTVITSVVRIASSIRESIFSSNFVSDL